MTAETQSNRAVYRPRVDQIQNEWGRAESIDIALAVDIDGHKDVMPSLMG